MTSALEMVMTTSPLCRKSTEHVDAKSCEKKKLFAMFLHDMAILSTEVVAIVSIPRTIHYPSYAAGVAIICHRTGQNPELSKISLTVCVSMNRINVITMSTNKTIAKS